MGPLGFFRSNPSDRAATSPTSTSPGFTSLAPFSDKDRDRFSPTSPPASPTKPKAATFSAGPSSNRLRRFKSGSFSLRRSDAPQSPVFSNAGFKEGDNGLDDLCELLPDRTSTSELQIERSKSTTVKGFRPRGASESSGDRARPRMWFLRHKTSSSALSDDEGDTQYRGLVISAPMPPIDGRPMKSITVMEDLAELQRKVLDQTASEIDGSVSAASVRMLVKSIPPTMKEDIINKQRPVTPPAIAEFPPADNYPTPLSPPKRNPNRTRKSPHIAPLVFRNGVTTTLAATPSPRSVVGSASEEMGSSMTRMDLVEESDQIRRSDSPSDHHLMSAATPISQNSGRSKLKGWHNTSHDPASSSLLSSQGPLAQPFVHTARTRDNPPRSISSDTSLSARSSPEPSSLDNQETEELRTSDDSEDSAVGFNSSSAISSFKMTGNGTPSRVITATTVPGYTIDVVCSEDSFSEDITDEVIKWEIIIRKVKSVTRSQSSPLQAPTSPIALSRGQTTAIPPVTASSINLSLALDKPSGKLVFLSLPVDPEQTPHQRTKSRKTEVPESPSSTSSGRFQNGSRNSPVSTNKPMAIRSPFYTDDSSDYQVPSSPIPVSPRIGRFPSQRRKAPQQLISGSPLHDGIHDSFRLLTPRSPPASPRDQRRKASLQDGVLFTPDL